MINPGAAFAFDTAAHVIDEILNISDIEFEVRFGLVVSYGPFIGHGSSLLRSTDLKDS
jgi:hypothetical protein